MPWCHSPRPDLSAHPLGTLLGIRPPGGTSHKPAEGFGQGGKAAARPAWGGRLSHSCCWYVVAERSSLSALRVPSGAPLATPPTPTLHEACTPLKKLG